MTRLVFLDRDGTVAVDRHYLSDPQGVELLPGAALGIRRLRGAGLKVVIITNQSGIGRGLFDEARLTQIHTRLRELLADQGADLDGIYHCPHLPEVGCACRKPRTSLMERAAREHGSDLSRSFFVGDKTCDLDAGLAIGARTVLVRTGHGEATLQDPAARPDLVAADLAEAAEQILRWEQVPAAIDPLHVARARAHLEENARIMRLTADSCSETITHAAGLVANSLREGHKVMFCGNGGSAADSQHLAAELTNRLDAAFDRPPLAALALSVDSSFLTAHANDHGFATVFARQVEALGRPGDVLVAISTTGNSENVVRAVETARARGLGTIGFLGGSGGRLLPLVDVPVLVPDDRTPFIQESHIALGHILCDLIERLIWLR